MSRLVPGLLALALANAPLTAAADESIPLLTGPIVDMGPLPHASLPRLPQMAPRGEASPDADPAERPSRPFTGWVGPVGCDFGFEGRMWGRVQDGRISGMAMDGHAFNWPLAPDGSFSGELPLTRHARTGDEIRQWISGRVDGGRLVLDIALGIPGDPDSFCRAEGVELFIGG